MLYAGRDRSFSIRRKLPQNRRVRDGPPRGPFGRTTARVGPAAAVLRRVTVGSLTAGADRAVSEAVS